MAAAGECFEVGLAILYVEYDDKDNDNHISLTISAARETEESATAPIASSNCEATSLDQDIGEAEDSQTNEAAKKPPR